ncbi:MAG: winged helix-turn-helix domain-containing protein [Anaerolineae bacterium]
MAQDKRPLVVLEFGDLVLDQARQEVTVCGKAHHLTPKECRLLATFMQHPGKILSREFLMREIWETDYAEDTRTIEVHVSWLRKKIEEDSSAPQLIQTVRGVGYVFTEGE